MQNKLLKLQEKINTAVWLSNLKAPEGVNKDAFDQAQDALFEANQIINQMINEMVKGNKGIKGSKK